MKSADVVAHPNGSPFGFVQDLELNSSFVYLEDEKGVKRQALLPTYLPLDP